MYLESRKVRQCVHANGFSLYRKPFPTWPKSLAKSFTRSCPTVQDRISYADVTIIAPVRSISWKCFALVHDTGYRLNKYIVLKRVIQAINCAGKSVSKPGGNPSEPHTSMDFVIWIYSWTSADVMESSRNVMVTPELASVVLGLTKSEDLSTSSKMAFQIVLAWTTGISITERKLPKSTHVRVFLRAESVTGCSDRSS